MAGRGRRLLRLRFHQGPGPRPQRKAVCSEDSEPTKLAQPEVGTWVLRQQHRQGGPWPWPSRSARGSETLDTANARPWSWPTADSLGRSEGQATRWQGHGDALRHREGSHPGSACGRRPRRDPSLSFPHPPHSSQNTQFTRKASFTRQAQNHGWRRRAAAGPGEGLRRPTTSTASARASEEPAANTGRTAWRSERGHCRGQRGIRRERSESNSPRGPARLLVAPRPSRGGGDRRTPGPLQAGE